MGLRDKSYDELDPNSDIEAAEMHRRDKERIEVDIYFAERERQRRAEVQERWRQYYADVAKAHRRHRH